ncbi:MAG: hypothetical protein HYW78_00575 [Parcubacteria group bacterium]|nr:hypothetical protein [Parcubacteria group bacterium]
MQKKDALPQSKAKTDIKKKRHYITYQEHLKERLKDPKFRKMYEELVVRWFDDEGYPEVRKRYERIIKRIENEIKNKF